ncbi:MAG: ABC transporter ATP-binding protein [Bacteroidia bacterium]|nr:ABC transporter ATP-binding protein [Bacteroidia bacterium]
MALLRIESVTRRFGALLAVDGVSESVGAGEYFCMLGPSGCGKSTLLRMIGGFELPDSGRIWLDGRDITYLSPRRREVNLVFQNYALFPHLTVLENVEFGLKMKGVAAAERRRRAGEGLELVNMSSFASRMPPQLSGGQQQRVALARAIVNRPSLLLLDEPLAALDKHLREQMQRELKRLQTDTGIAFIHVTHDQEEALSLADRIGIMQGGRFLQVGSGTDLYEHPVNSFVASFLGDSNLFDAQVSAPNRLSLGGQELAFAGPGLTPGSTHRFLIRPERVVLAAPGRGLQACVRQVRYLGARLEYELELDGLRWLASAPPGPGTCQPGDLVSVSVAPEYLVPVSA